MKNLKCSVSHALARAIERQMVGIFGDEDVGDGRLGGHTALDQPPRRRRLDDDALAGPAAIAVTAGDEHPELRRHDVETLGVRRANDSLDRLPIRLTLANDMQDMAAAWGAFVLDVDDRLDPRQVRGERAPIGPTLGCALCPHCRSRGLFGRLVGGDALFAERDSVTRHALVYQPSLTKTRSRLPSYI